MIIAPPKDIQEFWAYCVDKGTDRAPHEDKRWGIIFCEVLSAHIHPISRGHTEIQISSLKPSI